MTAAHTAYDLTLTAQMASKLDRPAGKTASRARRGDTVMLVMMLIIGLVMAALSYFALYSSEQRAEVAPPTRTYVFYNNQLAYSFVESGASIASVASTGNGHAGLITTN